VVAYDKLTGDLKWRSAIQPGETGFIGRQLAWVFGQSGNAGYVSPSIVQVSGEDHLVMITAAKGYGRSAAGQRQRLDPLSGKVLWAYVNCSVGSPFRTRSTRVKVEYSSRVATTRCRHDQGSKAAGRQLPRHGTVKTINFEPTRSRRSCTRTISMPTTRSTSEATDWCA